MKKVSIYQLQGLEKFPYDLYNEEGNLLYSKEDLINPGLLMQLSFGKFYRKDDLEMLVQKNENVYIAMNCITKCDYCRKKSSGMKVIL